MASTATRNSRMRDAGYTFTTAWLTQPQVAQVRAWEAESEADRQRAAETKLPAKGDEA